MAYRDLSGLLGPVELNLSLRWHTSAEADAVRGTLRLHELSEYERAATLDDHSWTWLRQRLRPGELAFLDRMLPWRRRA